ncbi:hypothetical protein EB796_007135 [Bugula neritina]|uniref:Cytochrome P450 n=1 Tax=Bugula neritina TaxID=10212 RepID=A0A7J7KAB7_BUGNE|nr:hypothetical protein EB796_007135 [Bugula neritina]
MVLATTPVLIAIALALLAYLFIKWLKDPLRKIPGPRGLPFIGNTLSVDPTKLHMILYDWAEKYGDIMKISLFNTPMVVVNSTELAYDVLVKTGTDFQGRPPSPRADLVMGYNSLVMRSINDPGYQQRRHYTIKAIKGYGEGVAHLEDIIQNITITLIDDITKQDGRPMDVDQLCYGFLCCVMASLLYGEEYAYDDPVSQSISRMTAEVLKAIDPASLGALLDSFPVLFKQNIFLKETLRQIQQTQNYVNETLHKKIAEYKAEFDENCLKGILDQLILIQKQEVGTDDPVMDDDAIQDIILVLILGGMATSHSVLCQAFLDFLHEPDLQKRLQDEIDSQFEPSHIITLKDRPKLPLLQAYIYENLRYNTVTPILLPHRAIRDTKIAEYEIPANTNVLVNAFYTSHNPSVYKDPFTIKPERFLDEHGAVVPPGHPARYNSVGLSFGSGQKGCIGKNLAETRIFLFLANILQRFNILPVENLPNRDVRTYNFVGVLTPPSGSVKFIRRQ